MGLKYTKRAMTSYEVHRFFHGMEISFFPDTFIDQLLSITPTTLAKAKAQINPISKAKKEATVLFVFLA